MVGHNIAPHSQIISQRGKTGKGNPKDDFKKIQLLMYLLQLEKCLVKFEAGNSKLNCFLRPGGYFRFASQNVRACDVRFQGDPRYHMWKSFQESHV